MRKKDTIAVSRAMFNRLKKQVEEFTMLINHQNQLIWMLAYKEPHHEAIITMADAAECTSDAYYEVKNDVSNPSIRIKAYKTGGEIAEKENG